MKQFICWMAGLAMVGAILSTVPQLYAQAEGVKARAKALKRQVEGTNNTATVRTNAPGTPPTR